MHLLHCRETPAGPLTTGPRGAVVRSPLAPSGGLAYRRQCACRRPRRRSMAWYARHRRSSCFGIFKHVREVPHTCYLLAFSQWLVTPHVPSLRVGYCTAPLAPKDSPPRKTAQLMREERVSVLVARPRHGCQHATLFSSDTTRVPSIASLIDRGSTACMVGMEEWKTNKGIMGFFFHWELCIDKYLGNTLAKK